MAIQATFLLTISRVDEQIFNGTAGSVTLPGEKGQLTVLAHHEPIITLLKKGTIIVKTDTDTEVYEIERGMCEVSNNQVTILVQQ